MTSLSVFTHQNYYYYQLDSIFIPLLLLISVYSYYLIINSFMLNCVFSFLKNSNGLYFSLFYLFFIFCLLGTMNGSIFYPYYYLGILNICDFRFFTDFRVFLNVIHQFQLGCYFFVFLFNFRQIWLFNSFYAYSIQRMGSFPLIMYKSIVYLYKFFKSKIQQILLT